jgi:hypothetical protein
VHDIRQRFAREDGGVLTIAAIVLPLLLLLSAGGVSGFSLFASHRELQRAADQGALAGGASLPIADPNVLVSGAPFPLPDTEPVYALVEGATGHNLPRVRDLVPDPRAVACAVGADALSSAESAALINAFGEVLTEPPLGDDGSPISTVCSDFRIYPRIESNPDNTTPVECTDRLIEQVAEDAGDLDIDLLDPVLSQIQRAVNGVVRMPLNHVLPAAFTPRMRVTAYSKIRPPLLSLITGGDAGTMHVSATAYRRIKNAVVVPILPSQRLLIDLGVVDPIDVMTDPVNLNRALNTAQKPLINAITDADNRLDGLMASQGLPCDHMLHNLRQDLRDIYDPPTGPAPSARDIVDAAVTAAERTAARIGEAKPDPADPDSLAGEAFVLIGITVTDLMQPIAATQIPILDVALVSMSRASTGDFRAAAISAANAHGAFRATLVE